MHEAFDTLEADLDRIAERYRPAWETTPGVPSSRRVTAPGENPEVVVHYPPEWQPPPSQRKRLRARWDSPPPAASIAPVLDGQPAPLDQDSKPTDETLDAGSHVVPAAAVPPEGRGSNTDPDGEEIVPAAPSGHSLAAHSDDAEAFIAQAEATLGEARKRTELQDEPSDEAAHDGDAEAASHDGDSAPTSTPFGDGAATTPPALGFDSTAPAAYSRRPLAPPSRNRAGIWAAAGLAAMAVIGIMWRQRAPESLDVAAPPALDAASPTAAIQPAVVMPMSALPTREQSPPPGAASADETEASGPSDPLVATTSESESVSEAEPAADADARSRAEAPTGHIEDRKARAIPEPARHQPEEQPVEPAPRPPSHETPQAEGGPDAQQVAQALAAAASRANGCREATGPTGSGSVRVLLNPVGGVLNATVLGAYQGTSVGRCVENLFHRARTQPFSGRSLSTVYPFSIPQK